MPTFTDEVGISWYQTVEHVNKAVPLQGNMGQAHARGNELRWDVIKGMNKDLKQTEMQVFVMLVYSFHNTLRQLE